MCRIQRQHDRSMAILELTGGHQYLKLVKGGLQRFAAKQFVPATQAELNRKFEGGEFEVHTRYSFVMIYYGFHHNYKDVGGIVPRGADAVLI